MGIALVYLIYLTKYVLPIGGKNVFHFIGFRGVNLHKPLGVESYVIWLVP